MKSGAAYWQSREKRNLDLLLVAPMIPAYLAAKTALRISLDTGVATEIGQLRVGSGTGDLENRLFAIQKLHTKDESQVLPNGSFPTLGRMAELFRKLGIDELAQVDNVMSGEMTVFGPRPLVLAPMPDATCYEEVMDSDTPAALRRDWSRLIAEHQPGILGSWPLYDHVSAEDDPNRFEMRMTMDLEDAYCESTGRNVQILKQFAQLAIERRLQ